MWFSVGFWSFLKLGNININFVIYTIPGISNAMI